MFYWNTRIRYTEIGETGCLTPGALLNLFQDCSTFQSEDCGVGLDWLRQRQKAWLLSRWQVQLFRLPQLGEAVTVGTWMYAHKMAFGYRNFLLRDQRGGELAWGNAQWTLCDTASGAPVRVTDEYAAPYGVAEPPLAMGPMHRKLSLPEAGEVRPPVLIAPHMIDTNHHVNNARYVELAAEYLPAGFVPGELRVDYRRAATLGERLFPVCAAVPEGYTVGLCSEEGLPYAIVCFVSASGAST